MSYLFGSTAAMFSDVAGRRKLLVKVSTPERWSGLLQSIASEWDITWALDDQHFAVELSEGKFPVAAFEISPGNALSSVLVQTAPDITEQAGRRPESLSGPRSSRFPPTQFLLLQADENANHEPFGVAGSDVPLLAEIRPQMAPADFKRWLDVAFGVSQLKAETTRLQRRLANRRSPLIGNSAQIERLREQIATSALNDWPVLIQGEPGTGRDLVARAIHEASDRAHRPFVKIDCRVHSSLSLGRELFGYAAGYSVEQGGASINSPPEIATPGHSGVPGRLDLADGGVLLIDGIEEIALPLQAVLAQVLARKYFQRMGERYESPLNVRVMAVTSKDLLKSSTIGQFREDLLNQFAGPVLTTPNLREIRSDIGPLTEHLLQRISARLGNGPIRLLVESLTRLQAHSWPGNVSELEAMLERASVLNPGGKLTVEMIDSWLSSESQISEARLPGMTLAQMERQLIEATFARCAGNRELTASSLQIGLRTLSGKLREYGYPPRGGPGSNRNPQHIERDAA